MPCIMHNIQLLPIVMGSIRYTWKVRTKLRVQTSPTTSLHAQRLTTIPSYKQRALRASHPAMNENPCYLEEEWSMGGLCIRRVEQQERSWEATWWRQSQKQHRGWLTLGQALRGKVVHPTWWLSLVIEARHNRWRESRTCQSIQEVFFFYSGLLIW